MLEKISVLTEKYSNNWGIWERDIQIPFELHIPLFCKTEDL